MWIGWGTRLIRVQVAAAEGSLDNIPFGHLVRVVLALEQPVCSGSDNLIVVRVCQIRVDTLDIH